MIKTFLLTSAAGLLTFSAAQAADAIIAAEPEPMEYVRVCDTFGKGYFYIPGTETCLKLGGYVRFDSSFGESPYSGEDVGWSPFTRGTITLDARSQTEYGQLRSFIELRGETTDDSPGSRAYINSAYIELGGFRAGLSDSRYDTWLNSAGNIINDDVIDYTGDRTNQVSYVFGGETGFAALIGAEEGGGGYEEGAVTVDYAARNDIAHPLLGARYVEDWGGLYIIAGYDSRAEAFGGKIRGDLKINDTISLFAMAGYQSDWDNTKGIGGTRQRNYYGPWYGDWAVWGGASAKLSDKANLNLQAAYEEDGTFAGAINVEYAVVEGLKLQPELNYTDFNGIRGTEKAFGGTIRLQRDF